MNLLIIFESVRPSGGTFHPIRWPVWELTLATSVASNHVLQELADAFDDGLVDLLLRATAGLQVSLSHLK